MDMKQIREHMEVKPSRKTSQDVEAHRRHGTV